MGGMTPISNKSWLGRTSPLGLAHVMIKFSTGNGGNLHGQLHLLATNVGMLLHPTRFALQGPNCQQREPYQG